MSIKNRLPGEEKGEGLLYDGHQLTGLGAFLSITPHEEKEIPTLNSTAAWGVFKDTCIRERSTTDV